MSAETPAFVAWLADQSHRTDAVGDLAVYADTIGWPRWARRRDDLTNSFAAFDLPGGDGRAALKTAWREWKQAA